MNIRFLGTHKYETKNTKCICLLIDNILALDAGGFTSSLSIPAQRKLKAILLTHEHYDHIRDIPMIAINLYAEGNSTNVYCSPNVRDAIETHLLNGKLYPKFQELPAAKPTLKFIPIEPHKHTSIEGYDIVAIPVNHGSNAVGYQITDKKGRVIFYTTDTGPGLNACWEGVSPDLLIIEVTAPNGHEELATSIGHLTPHLLKRELINFREMKGYLPQIFIVHMDPEFEREIGGEINALAESLGTSIVLAYEGMRVRL